jgi:hypothetical protein
MQRLQVTGSRVAIKKISKVFRNLGDARRILREMKLLRYVSPLGDFAAHGPCCPRSALRLSEQYGVPC